MFRLAGHLHCTVAELPERISSDELTDWWLLESSVDPWGQKREDWRAALVAHTIVRCHAAAGDGKVWGADSAPRDFLLDFTPRAADDDWQSPEEQLAILKRAAALHRNQKCP